MNSHAEIRSNGHVESNMLENQRLQIKRLEAKIRDLKLENDKYAEESTKYRKIVEENRELIEENKVLKAFRASVLSTMGPIVNWARKIGGPSAAAGDCGESFFVSTYEDGKVMNDLDIADNSSEAKENAATEASSCMLRGDSNEELFAHSDFYANSGTGHDEREAFFVSIYENEKILNGLNNVNKSKAKEHDATEAWSWMVRDASKEEIFAPSACYINSKKKNELEERLNSEFPRIRLSNYVECFLAACLSPHEARILRQKTFNCKLPVVVKPLVTAVVGRIKQNIKELERTHPGQTIVPIWEIKNKYGRVTHEMPNEATVENIKNAAFSYFGAKALPDLSFNRSILAETCLLTAKF